MLRSLLAAIIFMASADMAFANLEMTYEESLAEYTYTKCFEAAAAKRIADNPTSTLEENRSGATLDCAAQLPPFLRKIGGKTIKELYGQCYDTALERRASTIPVKPKKTLTPMVIADCENLELQYLGFDLTKPDKTALDSILSQRHSRKLKELNDNAGGYELKVGESIAMLIVTLKYCSNANKPKLEKLRNGLNDRFEWPPAVPKDFVDFLEFITHPMEEYDYDARKNGPDLWCHKVKQRLEEAGIKDGFLN